MRSILWLSLALVFVSSAVSAGTEADPLGVRIQGDYLEVRTADVWTGPCFANGEVNLTGKEGLMAWHVNSGQWNGVSLESLKVVAVVRANVTLGDPYAGPLHAKSVIVVDSRATKEQSEALVALAQEMGGALLADVVAVERAPIQMEISKATGSARLKAGKLVELETRALCHHDMHCGNEFVYYPPLSEVASAQPAFALAHRYNGDDLGATWSSPGKRSAFVGAFSH